MPEILLLFVDFAGVVPFVGLLLEPLSIQSTRQNVARLEYPAACRTRAQKFLRAPQLFDENVCCVFCVSMKVCRLPSQLLHRSLLLRTLCTLAAHQNEFGFRSHSSAANRPSTTSRRRSRLGAGGRGIRFRWRLALLLRYLHACVRRLWFLFFARRRRPLTQHPPAWNVELSVSFRCILPLLGGSNAPGPQ